MILTSVYSLLVLMLICVNCCACDDIKTSSDRLPRSRSKQTVNPMMMNTNIALVGADPATTRVRKQDNVVIDPTVLLSEAGLWNDNTEMDIEEDENDKFITTRSGKLRPRFESGLEDWSEDIKSR